jgi:L-histidine Nalpha-methyltransferase
MRLRSRRTQQVRLADLDLTVAFQDGEDLRTEISAKFRRAGLEREFGEAGFGLEQWWTDSLGRFSLSLWSPAPDHRG